MKKFAVAAMLAVVLVLTGCSSAQKSSEAGSKKKKAPPATTALVVVEGKEKGAGPGTFYIRRNEGETHIAFRVRGQEVRTYEVERTRSSNASSLELGFGNDETNSRGKRYDSTELRTKDPSHFLIPFHPTTITVEDREYGITLVIRD